MENGTARKKWGFANVFRRKWVVGGVLVAILIAIIAIVSWHAYYCQYLPERFKFPAAKTGLHFSLDHFDGDCKIDVIRGEWRQVTLAFKRGDRVVLELETHKGVAFVAEDDVLYIANFFQGSQGCSLVTYDLKSGRKLWTNNLYAIPLGTHSEYFNEVAIELIPGAIRVFGQESFGAYVEIVDRHLGVSVAHKIY